MLGSTRALLLAGLVAIQGYAGCLSTGNEQEAWWETRDQQWPPWPGMDATETRPAPLPWFSSYVERSFEAAREDVREGYERRPSSFTVQAADWHLSEANRSVQANAPLWTIDDLAKARAYIDVSRVHEEKPDGDERILATYLQNRSPLQSWERLQGEADEAWRASNLSGLTVLFSLIEGWGPARASHEELARGQTERAVDSLHQAARIAAFTELALPVVENASKLPGSKPVPTDADTFAVLHEVTGAIVSVTEEAPRSYQESGHFDPVRSWASASSRFQEQGWDAAAAVAATTALVYAHTLHWSHEDHVPTVEEVHDALETLSGRSGPAGTLFAHLAWKGYISAEQDPAFMLLPVAIEELSPLLRALDERLLVGTEIPWGTVLDPLVESWGQGWLQTTRSHAS